jgi:cellobiose phosphorylase
MYRLVTETLLGLSREGSQLRLTPRLPQAWPGLTLHYRHHRTQYHLVISRHGEGAATDAIEIILDGQRLEGATIPLSDDARDHTAEVKIP